MRDDFPQAGYHSLSAIAVRRAYDDVVATHPGQQPGYQLGVHVKQRQSAKECSRRAVTFRAVSCDDLRDSPGVKDLAAVRAHCDFRLPGCAAGAKIR